MSDRLPIDLQQALPADAKIAEIHIPGDGHTIIAQAQKVENNIAVLLGDSRSGKRTAMNPDYYHLFVLGGESFEDDFFLVPKDRAITEGTSPELMERFASLTEEAISELKAFPALFAAENHMYGKTDEEQEAYYGLISDVKIQDNGIKVYYRILNTIRQQRLNELAFELGILGSHSFNELNRTHWAIKRINLAEALRKAGISVFTLS